MERAGRDLHPAVSWELRNKKTSQLFVLDKINVTENVINCIHVIFKEDFYTT